MLIVKIGGGKDMNINGIIKDLADIKDPFMIVHGANALRDALAEKMGYSKKVITSLSGYSSVYSDAATIDLMMMAYAGLQNKRIVELCQQNGINAVGLSGLDGKVIRGKRNTGIKTIQNGKKMVVRDFSGKPQSVNLDLLNLLLDNGYTPVLSVPILDEQNVAINSENDDIVALLHDHLKANTILQFIEAAGYLKDFNDPASVIPRITKAELAIYVERSEGRMKRKILALSRLFENAAPRVIIADGRVEKPVQDALAGKGTIIE